jgi:hypothetical protein
MLPIFSIINEEQLLAVGLGNAVSTTPDTCQIDNAYLGNRSALKAC